MLYNIWGGNLPAVTVKLETGESVYTQSGGMSWMTDGINMETNTRGGVLKGLGRMFSGNSMFMATYTAARPGCEITFASTMPGEIRAFNIRPNHSIIAQKGAFLCADNGVQFDICTPTGIGGGLFGGEGFILQRFHGNGTVFCELDGSIQEIDLAPGEVIKVDTGNVAAFEANVQYSVETIRGFKNILFGGEGLFLTTLRGPGRVWLQTMPVADLAKRIIPYVPHDSSR